MTGGCETVVSMLTTEMTLLLLCLSTMFDDSTAETWRYEIWTITILDPTLVDALQLNLLLLLLLLLRRVVWVVSAASDLEPGLWWATLEIEVENISKQYWILVTLEASAPSLILCRHFRLIFTWSSCCRDSRWWGWWRSWGRGGDETRIRGEWSRLGNLQD